MCVFVGGREERKGRGRCVRRVGGDVLEGWGPDWEDSQTLEDEDWLRTKNWRSASSALCPKDKKKKVFGGSMCVGWKGRAMSESSYYKSSLSRTCLICVGKVRYCGL